MFKLSTYRYRTRSLMVSTLKNKYMAKQFIFSEPKVRSKINSNIKHLKAINYFIHALKKDLLLNIQTQENSNYQFVTSFFIILSPLSSINGGFIYALKKAILLKLFYYFTKYELIQIVICILLLLSSLLSI